MNIPNCWTAIYAGLLLFAVAGDMPAYASAMFVTDAEYLNQPALIAIRADAAYTQGITGRGIRLGMIDTGINPNHQEFRGALAWAYDSVTGRSGSTGFSDFIRNYGDDGHGSHVASIMLARRDGADRPLNMHGVAYDAQLVLGAWDYADTYSGMDKRWSSAIRHVSAQSVTAINNSWVGYYVKGVDPDVVVQAFMEDYPRTVQAISGALDKGPVMVFGAGNASDPYPTAPAVLPSFVPDIAAKGGWITVVATKKNGLDEHGNPDMAFYTNLCGLSAKYCVAAPGGNAYRGSDPDGINGVDAATTDGYIYDSGTSMATPMVTGTVGLVAQKFPWMDARNLARTVLTTATHADAPSRVWGRGLVNIAKAIKGPGLFETEFHARVPAGMDSRFDNDIAGSGGLVKAGDGRLALFGHNAYTGASVVREGTLAVHGNTASSPFSVSAGGRLEGTGIVGPTILAGIIAPGASIGELTIAGDYVQSAGGVFEVEIAGDGRSDHLVVQGVAAIEPGAGLHVLPPDEIRPGTSYSFMTASDGIVGQHRLLPNGYLFIDEGLRIVSEPGKSASLYTVNRNSTPIATWANNGNQRSVATAIDRMPVGAFLHGRTMVLTDVAAMPSVLGGLSGDIHVSMLSAFTEHGNHLAGAVDARQRSMQNGGTVSGAMLTPKGSAVAPADNKAWIQASSAWTEWPDTVGAPGMRSRMGSVLAGVDVPYTRNVRLGMAAGVTRGTLQQDLARATVDGYHWFGYGSAQGDRMGVRVGLGHTWYDTSVQRHLPFGLPALSVDPAIQSTQAFAEFEVSVDMGSVVLRPMARLAWTRMDADGFQEPAGNPGALLAPSAHFRSTISTLGVRAAYSWVDGERTLVAEGMLGWRHAYGNVVPSRTVGFDTGPSFRVSGVPMARDALLLEAGIKGQTGKYTHVHASYSGQFGDGLRGHAIQGTVHIQF